jgi:hypothetical protein
MSYPRQPRGAPRPRPASHVRHERERARAVAQPLLIVRALALRPPARLLVPLPVRLLAPRAAVVDLRAGHARSNECGRGVGGAGRVLLASARTSRHLPHWRRPSRVPRTAHARTPRPCLFVILEGLYKLMRSHQNWFMYRPCRCLSKWRWRHLAFPLALALVQPLVAHATGPARNPPPFGETPHLGQECTAPHPPHDGHRDISQRGAASMALSPRDVPTVGHETVGSSAVERPPSL